jgi:hypothetical protein
MTRMRLYFASLLFAAGCSAAYADQIAGPGPRTALAIANAKIRAPYDVQVIREDGETLPTYAQKDRYYVEGNSTERYVIRVTNPTANRVEAVVTVDGLDVIDGEDGALTKRGYVIPAYGEVRIEGFRTSQDDVATFRFSSVTGSYAARKGKARNVGVIAAAIFEEQASPDQPQIVAPDPVRPGVYNYEDDLDARRGPSPSHTKSDDSGGGSSGRDRVAHADKKMRPPADAPAAPPPSASPPRGISGESVTATRGNYDDGDDEAPRAHKDSNREEQGRPGLGTEYGEQRNSSATYTRFVRNGNRPIAIAELRYNDAAGLAALGINVAPIPDERELMTRETADPFPGQHYAQPPR